MIFVLIEAGGVLLAMLILGLMIVAVVLRVGIAAGWMTPTPRVLALNRAGPLWLLAVGLGFGAAILLGWDTTTSAVVVGIALTAAVVRLGRYPWSWYGIGLLLLAGPIGTAALLWPGGGGSWTRSDGPKRGWDTPPTSARWLWFRRIVYPLVIAFVIWYTYGNGQATLYRFFGLAP